MPVPSGQLYARADDATATDGIGIGLSAGRLLAQIMGGEIACLHSDERTEFRLALPGAAAEAIPEHETVSVR